MSHGIHMLLKEKIGLDTASLGTELIDRAVRDRMAACSVKDYRCYEERLRIPAEMQALIDAVIVPETWFFRDGEPFRLVQKYAMNTWWPTHPGGKLRALSIPCSTGEEPYSIAMALLDAGLTPMNFVVEGVDICSRSLETARQACYGSNSFRGKNLEFRDVHFKAVGAQHKLNDIVRECVKFAHGNLLNPLFLADHEPYDIVFCRNLLIYFDAQGRESAVKALGRLLKKAGLLFMGHAEALEMLDTEFESARHPHAFAYRHKKPVDPPRATAGAGNAPTRQIERGRIAHSLAKFQAKRTSKSKQPVTQHQTTQPQSAKHAGARLADALKLADQGKLDEAIQVCRTYLAQNQTDADAHCLLGVIFEAQGNTNNAEASYNKALYLNNAHAEALVHLMLLFERKGERSKADLLRQRASRLKPSN